MELESTFYKLCCGAEVAVFGSVTVAMFTTPAPSPTLVTYSTVPVDGKNFKSNTKSNLYIFNELEQ
jgi:hypothetical protein